MDTLKSMPCSTLIWLQITYCRQQKLIMSPTGTLVLTSVYLLSCAQFYSFIYEIGRLPPQSQSTFETRQCWWTQFGAMRGLITKYWLWRYTFHAAVQFVENVTCSTVCCFEFPIGDVCSTASWLQCSSVVSRFSLCETQWRRSDTMAFRFEHGAFRFKRHGNMLDPIAAYS